MSGEFLYCDIQSWYREIKLIIMFYESIVFEKILKIRIWSILDWIIAILYKWHCEK